MQEVCVKLEIQSFANYQVLPPTILKLPDEFISNILKFWLPTPASFIQRSPCQLSTLCTSCTMKPNFSSLNSGPQSIVLQLQDHI